jgi:hypothetical protein
VGSGASPHQPTNYLLVALGPVHTWVRKEREKVGSFAPPTFFFPSQHPSITCPNYRLIFSNGLGEGPARAPQPITKQLTINTGLGRMCWSEEAELRSFLRPTPSRPVLHVLENIFCVGGLEGAAQPSNTKRVFYLDMQIDFTLT